METDEIRECLVAMTRDYMERIIEGIRKETIDAKSIDHVWDACEDLLRTPPNDDDRGSWLCRLERPWRDDMDPEEFIRLAGLDR